MSSPFASLAGFDWTTPFIADACVLLGLPVRLGPPGIAPMAREMRVAGPVAPAVHSGSTDVFLEAIAEARRGDVLVIDNNGRLDEGCIGDLVAGEAHMSGLAAIIVDGAHRDSAAVRAIGIPVWSRGTSPTGPLELRRRHSTALDAATCGPTTVTRQDAVFADEDGVVFVALAECPRVIDAARDIATREQAQAAKLMSGELLRDQLDLAGYLRRRGDDPEFTFRAHLKSMGGAIEI
ncbi:MAG: RraA family protein [Acidobacteria bacterium]|nr:RraA family protein [Acidobacteriota bacterium]